MNLGTQQRLVTHTTCQKICHTNTYCHIDRVVRNVTLDVRVWVAW